jgi:hypothetical protein
MFDSAPTLLTPSQPEYGPPVHNDNDSSPEPIAADASRQTADSPSVRANCLSSTNAPSLTALAPRLITNVGGALSPEVSQ